MKFPYILHIIIQNILKFKFISFFLSLSLPEIPEINYTKYFEIQIYIFFVPSLSLSCPEIPELIKYNSFVLIWYEINFMIVDLKKWQVSLTLLQSSNEASFRRKHFGFLNFTALFGTMWSVNLETWTRQRFC